MTIFLRLQIAQTALVSFSFSGSCISSGLFLAEHLLNFDAAMLMRTTIIIIPSITPAVRAVPSFLSFLLVSSWLVSTRQQNLQWLLPVLTSDKDSPPYSSPSSNSLLENLIPATSITSPPSALVL